MPSIRKVKTASGATAVQVVRNVKHRVVILKHIGSAHTEQEEEALVQAAREWIEKYSKQGSLFPAPKNRLLHLDHAELVGIRYSFAYEFFRSVFARIGFDALKKNRLLLDLAVMRIR